MSLAPGARLGPYEILSAIGAGGMGEVYKARDTRLDRTVAIKILPSSDPVRRQRFEREARAVAALNHPHICTLHDVGQQDGTDFLVMEYLEGQTLAERLRKSALPLDQALQYAIQIAEALETAHRRGIVHRDLKPGNVMLTKAGAKLLDFGIATIRATPPTVGGEAATGSDRTLTAEGTLIGTLNYMAPEQLEGGEADARSDLFAFGAVVYEMLTGRRAFAGDSESKVIAAVLDSEPPLILTSQPSTPPVLEHVVRRCLAKDPDERWQTTHDVILQLKWIAENGPTVSAKEPDKGRSRRASRGPISSRWLVATGLTIVVGIAAATFLVWARVRVPTAIAPNATRFFVGVTPADVFGPGPSRASRLFHPYPTRTDVALSPDGTLLVFSGRKNGRQQLYLLALNRLDATPIAGTDNSNSPFFSPDGQWLGFWTGAVEPGAIGELKKVRLDGSPAVTLAKVAPLRGATWGSNDIVFATVEGEGRLWRVPAAGGMPETLTRLDSRDGRRNSLPHMLPDGRGVLYTIGGEGSNFADGQIAVTSLVTGDTHVVLDQGVDARYVSSGHLVYVRDGTLMAVPFDLKGLRVTGTPVAIVKDVMQAVRTSSLSLTETGAAQFSVSETGALVYVPGVTVPEILNSLVWVSRNGTVTPTKLTTVPYGGPRLSPDGQRVALASLSRGTVIHDLARGGLVPVAPGVWPTFTPDGKQITVPGPSGFVSVSLEGGVTNRFGIAVPRTPHVPGSWSPDGQTLLFTQFVANGVWEIRALSRMGGDRKVHPGGDALINERYPQFSPDGEWFVYSSSEPGEQEEVYVERYRGAGERYPISTNGGTAPAWAPSGRELFYETIPEQGRIKMMAVDVTLSPAFAVGIPHVLFEGPYQPGTPQRHYDVSRDGRFLMLQTQEAPAPPPVTQMVLVLNWFEELKRLAPGE